jgi:hypothetical protein
VSCPPVTITTGVRPRRPQVRPLGGGLRPWPDSSWKQSQAPRSAAGDGHCRTCGLRVRCSVHFFSLNCCRAMPVRAGSCHFVRSPVSAARSGPPPRRRHHIDARQVPRVTDPCPRRPVAWGRCGTRKQAGGYCRCTGYTLPAYAQPNNAARRSAPRPQPGSRQARPLRRVREQEPSGRHAISAANRGGTCRQRGPSMAVRGKLTVTPTALPARTQSAMRPWTPRRIDSR